MRVLIIGGGVVGVTSAWYLSQAGHEVTVIEKNGDVALETSAANAGQISPGYSAPLAAPGIPLKALKWMLQKHAPLAFRPDGTRFQLEWMWSMLRNCTPEHYQQNKGRMVRIAEYSRDSLKQLRAVTGIEYEGRQGGTLQLFRTVQQYESAEKDIKVLRAAGVPYRLLPAEQLPDMEPALATCLHRLTGGLHLPNDETGDCQLFTRHLTQMAEAAGVKFIYHQQVDQIRHAEMAVTGVRCGAEWYTADHYVLAAGVWSRRLLDGLIDIPVYPLKGYSLTIPIIHSELAPVSTVLDESYKVAVTRFNDRIRVGGMAEIVGFNQQLSLTRRETLERVVKDFYPQGGDLTKASFWAGLRPMTPDGTPIVGPTPVRNLFLNTGHGTLGWTMACGSARLLSDLISGRTPNIAADDLSVMRYLPGFDAAGIRLQSHFG